MNKMLFISYGMEKCKNRVAKTGGKSNEISIVSINSQLRGCNAVIKHSRVAMRLDTQHFMGLLWKKMTSERYYS